MTHFISAKKILVVFPNSYTLQEAHDIVSRWNPDTINWGVINGNPNIYVTSSIRIQQKVKKLSDRGINFYSGGNITKIPSLNSPPLDDPPACQDIDQVRDENDSPNEITREEDTEDTMRPKAGIYFLASRFLDGSYIYKVGKAGCIRDRTRQYPQNFELILQFECSNNSISEKEVIQVVANLGNIGITKCVKGSEYFRSETNMVREIKLAIYEWYYEIERTRTVGFTRTGEITKGTRYIS